MNILFDSVGCQILADRVFVKFSCDLFLLHQRYYPGFAVKQPIVGLIVSLELLHQIIHDREADQLSFVYLKFLGLS